MPLRFRAIRRLLIGRPLRTAEAAEERLGIFAALAILSSDALSSVAYATEEMLRVLVLAGAAGLALTLPVGFAIAALIAVVSLSYRQTVRAYPGGAIGGSATTSSPSSCPSSSSPAGGSISSTTRPLSSSRRPSSSNRAWWWSAYPFI